MRETLFSGGTVLTMDEAQPRAEALLARDNRIAAIGNAALVRSQASPGATIIDLEGKTILPGFNDAHAHIQDIGRTVNIANLEGLNKDEIIECIRELDKKLPPGRILLASDWDYPDCPDPRLNDLDEAVPHRPVFLTQHSGHAAWVNSATLLLLGIDKRTADWDGGGPDRDRDGNLTGILREPGQCRAVQRIWFKMIRDKAAVRENLDRALRELARFGITSAQDNTWFPWNLDAISEAYRSGRLSVRISCWSFGAIAPIGLWMDLKRYNDDWFARGPRKFQLDGAFSTHTAWLTEAYADQPASSGAGVSTGKLRSRVMRASRQGRQLACHSIGDAATRAYVSAVADVDRSVPVAELRHRVEHGQLVADGDIERAAGLGMVFSGQPFAAADPGKDAVLLGETRASRAYPYRSLLAAGVPLAFGSDFPGESTLNPFEAIHIAVNRESREAIDVAAALSCYTVGSAFAEFKENEKGRLRPGYLADLIVISDDPTRIEISRIKEIRVEATIVGGRLVYSREGWNQASGLAP